MTRSKHLGLWLGIPGGLAVTAAVAASLVLTAPGVSVAGASVGLLPQTVAAENISAHLAALEVRVGDATFTGAELGASVDAPLLARQALAAHPLWKVTAWNPRPAPGAVSIDPNRAVPALRSAAPQLFADPTDARVVFDKAAGTFAAVASEPGRGVDLDALASTLSTALAHGQKSVSVTPTQTETGAATTTTAARALAGHLNEQAKTAGFYVHDQRVEAVPFATVASWLTISADHASHGFAVTPDESAVTAAVAGLPGRANRQAQNATVVTNSAGSHLRAITAGHDGIEIGDTSDVAEQVVASLRNGDLTFSVPGHVTAFQTTTLFRRIEVDKSAGATYLYEGPTPAQERLVATYPVAIGTGGEHETRSGHFTVSAQLTTQDMGDCNGTSHKFGYCTRNVPWVSYFDGDQGFHGTYWHHNFGPGARMSHGCVNMRIPDAQALYRFAQVGTEVWVHE